MKQQTILCSRCIALMSMRHGNKYHIRKDMKVDKCGECGKKAVVWSVEEIKKTVKGG